MSEPFSLSPELEECVRDLATHRDARLFRADPRTVLSRGVPSAFRRSAAEAGLLPVERELLAVHRAELAYLLRWLFLDESSRSSDRGARFYVIEEPPPRKQWEVKARFALASKHIDSDTEPASEVLRTYLSSGGLGRTQLALVALGVEDTATSRVNLGDALLAERQPRSAYALLSGVCAVPPAPLVRKCAHEVLASTCDVLGDIEDSLKHSHLAAQIALADELGQKREVTSLVLLLLFAVAAGHRPTARWAEERLDTRTSALDATVRAAITAFRNKAALTQLTHSADAAAVALAVRNASRGPAGEVVDEVF